MNLPENVLNNINVINRYFIKYNITSPYYEEKIKTLKYIENFNLKEYGIYDHSTNKLTINPEKIDDKKVISHELLHIAGGFNNHVGLNEFSTQYLNSVIFGAKKGHFEKTDYKMIDSIVKLIGFDNFFKCYLLRNIDTLITLLKNYYEENIIYSIFITLDKYYSWYTNLTQRQSYSKHDLEKEFKKLLKSKSTK